jgi:hypothetical protein
VGKKYKPPAPGVVGDSRWYKDMGDALPSCMVSDNAMEVVEVRNNYLN